MDSNFPIVQYFSDFSGDETYNFVVLYRSPSQSQDEFETFSDNFEINFSKIIILDLLDPNQTVFLTASILRVLDWSHDSN